MFYAEIDENKKCYHVTPCKLPESETIIAVDNGDVLGKVWDGEKFIDDPNEEPAADAVTTDSILEAIEKGVNEV